MSVLVHKMSAKPVTKQHALRSAMEAGLTQKELNTRDGGGRTVLFYAARYGKTQVVKNLLNAGCDANVGDNEGSTPLLEATERSHVEVIKALLRHDHTNVNAKNRYGQTALMKAVLYDDVEVAKILHKAGADLEETDSTGKTALLLAFADGRQNCLDYLMKSKCDVNVVDKLGQSALFLAVKAYKGANSCQIKKLLKQGYDVEKDKTWMSQAGIDTDTLKEKNIFKRLVERLNSTQRRRHSEFTFGRSTSQIHVDKPISHAHPRFRFRHNSSII